MARTKTNFDLNNLFFSGVNSQPENAELLASPILPAVIAAYNKSGRTLRVGKIHKNSGRLVIPMVTDLGFSALHIMCNHNCTPVEYGARIVLTPLSSVEHTSYGADGILTTNPRYMVNKLVNDNHSLSSSFIDNLANVNNLLNRIIYTTIDRIVDRSFGEGIASKPMVNGSKLTSGAVTFLVRMFSGEVSVAEAPASMRSELSKVFEEYTLRNSKFIKAIDDTKDFFSGEKFVFLNQVNGGVVLGAIRPEPAHAALEIYKSGAALPFTSTHSYTEAPTVPFKWYPSIESIPEDLQRELNYSLLMFKEATHSSDLLGGDFRGQRINMDVGGYFSSGEEGGNGAFIIHR